MGLKDISLLHLICNIVVYTWIGHFLPEEDDKFLEKVRAAFEEEERQAKAAAETDAAKDAIATAEESRKTIQSHRPEPGDLHASTGADKVNQDQKTESKDKSDSTPVNEMEKGGPEGLGSASLHDSVANLPLEFYHYYYGSNHDLGTLIEVILANVLLIIYSCSRFAYHCDWRPFYSFLYVNCSC